MQIDSFLHFTKGKKKKKIMVGVGLGGEGVVGGVSGRGVGGGNKEEREKDIRGNINERPEGHTECLKRSAT